MYWIAETSIVEGKVEIHTGTNVIGLCYPEGEKEQGGKMKEEKKRKAMRWKKGKEQIKDRQERKNLQKERKNKTREGWEERKEGRSYSIQINKQIFEMIQYEIITFYWFVRSSMI